MKTLITYKGAELDVTYYIQPSEPENGIQASIDIDEISHEGTDFYEILCDQFDDIEIQIGKELEDMAEDRAISNYELNQN